MTHNTSPRHRFTLNADGNVASIMDHSTGKEHSFHVTLKTTEDYKVILDDVAFNLGVPSHESGLGQCVFDAVRYVRPRAPLPAVPPAKEAATAEDNPAQKIAELETQLAHTEAARAQLEKEYNALLKENERLEHDLNIANELLLLGVDVSALSSNEMRDLRTRTLAYLAQKNIIAITAWKRKGETP